jgi:hypothetical protein
MILDRSIGIVEDQLDKISIFVLGNVKNKKKMEKLKVLFQIFFSIFLKYSHILYFLSHYGTPTS